MALPRGANGLSAVCDCGISRSYTLTNYECQCIGMQPVGDRMIIKIKGMWVCETILGDGGVRCI